MGETPSAPLACLSVVLCDDLYRDDQTGKMVIVGTFNWVNAPSLPYVLPRMAVLITLTGGHGTHEVSVSIEHERTGNEVFRIGGPMALSDPLEIADIDLRLQNVKFLDEGKHWVVIRDGSRIVSQRPFAVRLVAKEEEHQ